MHRFLVNVRLAKNKINPNWLRHSTINDNIRMGKTFTITFTKNPSYDNIHDIAPLTITHVITHVEVNVSLLLQTLCDKLLVNVIVNGVPIRPIGFIVNGAMS
jgi:phosphoribosylformylglycinamidine (FGAM) synthase PurS component